MRHAAFTIALALPLIASQGASMADDRWTAVPSAMQGVWGKIGRCDVEADRLRLTAGSAAFGSDAPKPVHYSPEENSVHWVEEYEVDNFVPGGSSDFLVYNSQGFHMPGSVGYERCGADFARLPWPFKAGPVNVPN